MSIWTSKSCISHLLEERVKWSGVLVALYVLCVLMWPWPNPRSRSGSRGNDCQPPSMTFIVFFVLAKRLAGKNISEITYFVSSGMQNLNSVNQPGWLGFIFQCHQYSLFVACRWTSSQNSSCAREKVPLYMGVQSGGFGRPSVFVMKFKDTCKIRDSIAECQLSKTIQLLGDVQGIWSLKMAPLVCNGCLLGDPAKPRVTFGKKAG